jgi:MFS family permease
LGLIVLGKMGIRSRLDFFRKPYINRLIPSKHRATLLSFQAMAFSVMMVVFFPIVGGIASMKGFKPAFLIIFVVSIPVLLLTRELLLRGIRQDGNRDSQFFPS